MGVEGVRKAGDAAPGVPHTALLDEERCIIAIVAAGLLACAAGVVESDVAAFAVHLFVYAGFQRGVLNLHDGKHKKKPQIIRGGDEVRGWPRRPESARFIGGGCQLSLMERVTPPPQ